MYDDDYSEEGKEKKEKEFYKRYGDYIVPAIVIGLCLVLMIVCIGWVCCCVVLVYCCGGVQVLKGDEAYGAEM